MSDHPGKTIRKPIDPTTEPEELMNDTTGLTGITKNNTSDRTITQKELHNTPISGENNNSDTPQGTARSMSEEQYRDAIDQAEGVNSEKEPPTYRAKSDPYENFEKDIGTQHPAPHVKGELSVSGSTTHPASDDDTLVAEHGVGLKLDEDEDERQEMDIGSDIDRAEEHHRTH